MGTLVLGGERANALEHAKSVVLSSGGHAIHLPAYLFDGRTSKKGMFLANGADLTITVDLDQSEDGGFEDSGLVASSDESTGAGATASTAVAGEFDAGVRALKCTAGAAPADDGIRKLEIEARAGQRLAIRVRMKSQTTSQTGRLRVYNPRTQKWLSNASAWGSSPVDAITNTVAAFTTKTLSFQVEGYSLVQDELTPLWVYFVCTGPDAGSAYFDEFSYHPQLNFCGLFRHNIGPGISPLFQSSPDNSAWTTEATLFPYKPAFYGKIAGVVEERWARFKIPGTNYLTPWGAELVMGYAETLARKMDYDPTYSWDAHNVVAEAMGGDCWAIRTNGSRRQVAMQFTTQTLAQFDENLLEIFLRSEGRRLPLVVVPDTDRPQDVIHGRIADTFSASRPYPTWHKGLTVTIDESPGPVDVA